MNFSHGFANICLVAFLALLCSQVSSLALGASFLPEIEEVNSTFVAIAFDENGDGYLNATEFTTAFDAYIPATYVMTADGSNVSIQSSEPICLNSTSLFGLFDPLNTTVLNYSVADVALDYVFAMVVKCKPVEADPCSDERLATYDLPLHLAAFFVILIASLVATGLPMLIKRKPRCFPFPFALIFGKHVGTGVLVALSLIHLLVPSFEALGSSCLVKEFRAYPFTMLFAMIAALMMHVIESISFLAAKEAVKAPEQSTKASYLIQEPKKVEEGAKGEVKDAKTIDELEEEDEDDGEHHGHSHGAFFGARNKTISAFILEFGLTTHSVIIGITTGVAPNNQMPTLIAALSFHQFFEGLALGSRIADVGFSGPREVLLLLIYSFSAPVGIAIGIPIVGTFNGSGATANYSAGIFDAISAGIIMYVAFVQMLGVEFVSDLKKRAPGLWRKIALFIGIWFGAGVMAIIGYWV